jgi:NAD+--dinitrogen-reductase ADP-D-ribosyltransferase
MRFLRGWMVDANSTAGAVLKGWVESRMGLIPTFHRGPIADLHDDAYETYLIDRMNGHACTNAILAQFDVLFHFVQYELHRRAPDVTHRTLYRGIHDLAEHEILGRSGEELVRMRLNNLNSFTSDFERAWEFGTRVLEAQVPVAKIFFQADILPSSILKGEEEVLVIGGEFDVKVRTH